MLDLVKILKDCPRGTKLYSPICGEVALDSVDEDFIYYPIRVNCDGLLFPFARNGRYHRKFNGECMLYPSKDQRDWNKFKASVKKFDYSTLKPFDRVLVRDYDRTIWRCSIFTCFYNAGMLCDEQWAQDIPYNDETKHLAGTTDMPDKKYIWWK